jgi:hypothetical protein
MKTGAKARLKPTKPQNGPKPHTVNARVLTAGITGPANATSRSALSFSQKIELKNQKLTAIVWKIQTPNADLTEQHATINETQKEQQMIPRRTYIDRKIVVEMLHRIPMDMLYEVNTL